MTKDPYLKTAFEKFSEPRQESQKRTLDEGINKMCVDHKFTFLFYNIESEEDPCKIIKIPSVVIHGYVTLITRYASPYVTIFNRL